MKAMLIAAIVCFVLFSGAVAHAESVSGAANISQPALIAKNELLRAESAITEMQKSGFNTTRVNDLLLGGQQSFAAQLSYEQKTGSASYKEVLKSASDIQGLKTLAFSVSDELKALDLVIKERQGSINATEPLALYASAKEDLQAERYESAREKIARAYDKISELEAASTTGNILIKASKTFGEKLLSMWKQIVIAAIIAVVAVILGIDWVVIYSKKLKMQKLLLEKKILEDLINKTQETYFNKGSMSETEYHIKIKKYGEFIREVNRQLPLLREEIEERKGTILKKPKRAGKK